MLNAYKPYKELLKNSQVTNLRFFAFKLSKNKKQDVPQEEVKDNKVAFQKNLNKKQIKHIKKKFKIFFTNPQNSKEYTEKLKSRKRKITNILSFVFNILVLAVVLIVSFAGQEDKSSVLFPDTDWKFIGIIGAVFVAQMIIDTLKYAILIKTSTKKARPYLAYKVAALGRYYDAVTPMSTGGQPFQMMYLNKRGIKGDIATSIPLVRYMFWQITYVIICSVILIYSHFSDASTQIFSTLIAWLAVGANLAILLTVLFLSISKKVGPLVVIWVLKLGSKMKLIKNYRVTFRKVMRFVVNYQKTMKMFAKNFWVLISQLILAALEILLFNIIPYFIYKAFVPNGTLHMVDILIMSIICNLTTGFIPTPGASGGAEAFFASIFGGMFKGNTFWPLLVWRIATYYINMVQGLFVLVYDFLIGNKKYERQKLKELGVKPVEPTFIESLVKNRETISIVQAQEEDKLIMQSFFAHQLKNTAGNNEEEVIKDSDFVTAEEMKKEVSTAEQVLTKVRIKEIKKRKAKKQKKQIKKERKEKRK